MDLKTLQDKWAEIIRTTTGERPRSEYPNHKVIERIKERAARELPAVRYRG